MNRKKIRNGLILCASIVIAFYLIFYVILPLIYPGFTSVYYIHNGDSESHIFSVKIINTTNKTILNQTYEIQPNSSIHYDRGFGWYPTISLTPITWSEGTYTFIATLDANQTKSLTTDLFYSYTIWININPDSSLEIGKMAG
jgi:hypothetical protein